MHKGPRTLQIALHAAKMILDNVLMASTDTYVVINNGSVSFR